MISSLLATVFEPRSAGRYVGRHRAPRERYVARVQMPAAARPPVRRYTPGGPAYRFSRPAA